MRADQAPHRPTAGWRHRSDLLPQREPIYAEADMTVQSREVPHEAIVDEMIAGLAGQLGIATALRSRHDRAAAAR